MIFTFLLISLSYGFVNSWGSVDKNGTFNGLTGQLVENEIDIGGTSMFIIKERIKVLNFLPFSTPTEYLK